MQQNWVDCTWKTNQEVKEKCLEKFKLSDNPDETDPDKVPLQSRRGHGHSLLHRRRETTAGKKSSQQRGKRCISPHFGTHLTAT